MAEQFLTLMADLDENSQNIMGTWYEELQDVGFTGEQTKGLPFHISMACYPLDKEKEVVELVQRMAEQFTEVPVYISHVGVFPGGKVLFGAPDMNPELIAIHDASVEVESIQEFIWTPHTTMIIDEPEVVGKALHIFAKSFVPFFGKIVRLHLCAFWPTREIMSVQLKERG